MRGNYHFGNNMALKYILYLLIPDPLREGAHFSFKYTSPETLHVTICNKSGESQRVFAFPAVKPVEKFL